MVNSAGCCSLPAAATQHQLVPGVPSPPYQLLVSALPGTTAQHWLVPSATGCCSTTTDYHYLMPASARCYWSTRLVAALRCFWPLLAYAAHFQFTRLLTALYQQLPFNASLFQMLSVISADCCCLLLLAATVQYCQSWTLLMDSASNYSLPEFTVQHQLGLDTLSSASYWSGPLVSNASLCQMPLGDSASCCSLMLLAFANLCPTPVSVTASHCRLTPAYCGHDWSTLLVHALWSQELLKVNIFRGKKG